MFGLDEPHYKKNIMEIVLDIDCLYDNNNSSYHSVIFHWKASIAFYVQFHIEIA